MLAMFILNTKPKVIFKIFKSNVIGFKQAGSDDYYYCYAGQQLGEPGVTVVKISEPDFLVGLDKVPDNKN